MPARHESPQPAKRPRTVTTKSPRPRTKPKAARKASRASKGGPAPIDAQVLDALASLRRMRTQRDFDNLERFGITATNAIGVSMANIQKLAKRLGRSHELALALWETGCYEARMLTAFVDEPARVTPAQMDRWCRDFDNWGICDTLCFKLFDQTPHAWAKVKQWSTRRPEQEKRAAFALLASLAGHDKSATDAQFLEGLDLVERASTDERNFVMKGVSWALRRIATRNAALNAAALRLSRRLAESQNSAARWIGRDAVRELERNARKRGAGAGTSRS